MGEVAREQSLKRVLEPMVEDYDFILIDCQPSLGLLTINALTAADGVIIPLECEYFSLRGVALLIQTIEKVSERLNPQLELEGILATMYDARTLHGREVLEPGGAGVRHQGVPHRGQPHRAVPGDDGGWRADHDLRLVLAGCRGVPGPGPRGGGPMPRRVILPGADELFRSTGSVQRAPEADDAEPTARRRPRRRRDRGADADGDRLSEAAASERPAAPRREDHRLRLAGGAGRPRARPARCCGPTTRWRSTAAGSCARRSRSCWPTSRPRASRASWSAGCGPASATGRPQCSLRYVNLRRCWAWSWASPPAVSCEWSSSACHRWPARRSAPSSRRRSWLDPYGTVGRPAGRDRLVTASRSLRPRQAARRLWTMVVVAVARPRGARPRPGSRATSPPAGRGRRCRSSRRIVGAARLAGDRDDRRRSGSRSGFGVENLGCGAARAGARSRRCELGVALWSTLPAHARAPTARLPRCSRSSGASWCCWCCC